MYLNSCLQKKFRSNYSNCLWAGWKAIIFLLSISVFCQSLVSDALASGNDDIEWRTQGGREATIYDASTGICRTGQGTDVQLCILNIPDGICSCFDEQHRATEIHEGDYEYLSGSVSSQYIWQETNLELDVLPSDMTDISQSVFESGLTEGMSNKPCRIEQSVNQYSAGKTTDWGCLFLDGQQEYRYSSVYHVLVKRDSAQLITPSSILPSENSSEPASTELTGGAVVGIVLGVTVVATVIVIAVVCFAFHRWEKVLATQG